MNSPACAERFDELEVEYIQAHDMINRGCLLVLNDLLRKSLSRVAHEVQGAFNDGAIPITKDIVMFCASEAKKAWEENRDRPKEEIDNDAHTLSYYSGLWLSETQTCH